MQREKLENFTESRRFVKKEQLTVNQKIEKELAYVTQAMDLDEYG